MKKIVLTSIVLALISCTRDNCVDYLILNKSNDLIKILNYENGLVTRTLAIEKNKQYSELSICDRGGNSVTYSGIDSIEIKVNNVVRKIYKPTDQGKSIYKIDDRNSWELVESKSYYSKFVFEITEEDLD